MNLSFKHRETIRDVTEIIAPNLPEFLTSSIKEKRKKSIQ